MTDQHILLVEDNPDDEALTLRALKTNNILNAVTVAHDGAEALEFLFAVKARDVLALPALILLDLKLPKIGGLEVLRRIRDDEGTRLIPVVVLTTSQEDEDVLSSYQAGANAYVQKPVNFSDFTKVVGAIGLFWLVLSEPPPRFLPATGQRQRHEPSRAGFQSESISSVQPRNQPGTHLPDETTAASGAPA